MRLKEVRVLQGRGHVGHHQQVQQQEVSGEDVRAGVQQDELQQLQGQAQGGFVVSGRPGFCRSISLFRSSISIFLYLPIFFSVYQSIYFCIYPYVSICLSACLTTHLSIYQTVYRSIYLTVYMLI